MTNKDNPPWWKVALFGSFAPGASRGWRRQRLLYALALAMFSLAVWGIGEAVIHLA